MRYKVIVCYNKDEENFLTFGSIQIYVDLFRKHEEDIFWFLSSYIDVSIVQLLILLIKN